MNIVKIEQIQVNLPFKTPFQTSYGRMTHKKTAIYIVHDNSGVYGLGELDALEFPDYIEETFDSATHTIEKHLIPSLLHRTILHPDEVSPLFSGIQGNFMAKSALETAVWDLYARLSQRPLRELIGGHLEKIQVGVSIGIQENIAELIQIVGEYIKQGYLRVKLKIRPGYDREPLTALRTAFPKLLIMADANSAYQTIEDWSVFTDLDQLKLSMIEQPFHPRDYVKHAALQAKISTPICLDESIRSIEDVQTAIALESCQSINLKVPRVGGLSEAKRIWEYCEEKGIMVWLGGMYEAGVGRALNLQVSSVPIFHFPGDLSAANRYFYEDIVHPELCLSQGIFPLPEGIGIGVDLDWKQLKKYQTGYKKFE